MLRYPNTPHAAAELVPLFRDGLVTSKVSPGETVLVYGDTFTLPSYPAAFLAAARDCGAEALHIVQPLLPQDFAQPIGRAKPTPLIIEAMKKADFVVDVSNGGMLYSYEQEAILAAGTRILRVREPDLPRPYRVWGYPVTPLLAIGLMGWMIGQTIMERPAVAGAGGLTVAMGLIVFGFVGRNRPG